MVWSPDKDFSYAEAAKIAPIVVQYMQGRALDVGPGTGKVWPQVIGIDQQMDSGRPCTDIVGKANELSLFADASMDAVFSSHCLEDFDRERVPAVLKEWARVLKIGGNLILYVPSANLYPLVGEPGANPAHRWNIYPGDIETLLKEESSNDDRRFHGWKLLLSEERGEDDEYSLLVIAQKTPFAGKWEEDVWQRNPDGKLRALVIRYGAIGDAIVCASIFPQLTAQGYHVTVNTTPKIQDVLRNDPHIDEWMIQETDYVPNSFLGPFWEVISKRYDKVINLCESIEGSLLALPGRLNHSYPVEARRQIMGSVNYLERTHDIAGVPYDFSGSRFYPSFDDKVWAGSTAHRMRGRDGDPIIIWCVNGSSAHKVYPWTHIVVRWLLERTPARIVLYGDPDVGARLSEAIIENVGKDGGDISRILSVGDKWKLRQSLSFAQFADVVVGPETGPLNAVAMEEEVRKVIYLSHSSPQNLTKHWKNTTVLLPEAGAAPCFPCHLLHQDWTHCHKSEKTGAALCASAVSPERVFKAVAAALGATVKEDAA